MKYHNVVINGAREEMGRDVALGNYHGRNEALDSADRKREDTGVLVGQIQGAVGLIPGAGGVIGLGIGSIWAGADSVWRGHIDDDRSRSCEQLHVDFDSLEDLPEDAKFQETGGAETQDLSWDADMKCNP